MRTNSLEHHLHLMERWPESWKGEDADIPAGAALVAAFTPFVRHLHVSGLSGRTRRRHLDHLWLLGGEIIRDVAMGMEDDAMTALRVIVSSGEGPLLRDASEPEQASMDTTCRKLGRFIEGRPLQQEQSAAGRPRERPYRHARSRARSNRA